MEAGLDKENGLEFSKPRAEIYGRKKKILKTWSQDVSTFQLFNFSAGMPFLYSKMSGKFLRIAQSGYEVFQCAISGTSVENQIKF
jgi:hypothetical protein